MIRRRITTAAAVLLGSVLLAGCGAGPFGPVPPEPTTGPLPTRPTRVVTVEVHTIDPAGYEYSAPVVLLIETTGSQEAPPAVGAEDAPIVGAGLFTAPGRTPWPATFTLLGGVQTLTVTASATVPKNGTLVCWVSENGQIIPGSQDARQAVEPVEDMAVTCSWRA